VQCQLRAVNCFSNGKFTFLYRPILLESDQVLSVSKSCVELCGVRAIDLQTVRFRRSFGVSFAMKKASP
jgi:molybdenum cofactor biosynthesis enzyme MoaA